MRAGAVIRSNTVIEISLLLWTGLLSSIPEFDSHKNMGFLCL